MTLQSWFWTTNNVGDGDMIDRAEWAQLWRNVLMGNGVLSGPGDQLKVSGAASPLSIATGWAFVGGYPVYNNAVISQAIPTPASGTTGHRLVLRATANTQLVELVLKSSADGVPSAPALQQDATFPADGTIYEISLAWLAITTLGVISLVDDRVWMVYHRALRIPNGVLKLEYGDLSSGNTGTPNVIGGYSGNGVTSGVQGAAILGGGELGQENVVTDHFGTVSGGYDNTAGNGGATLTDAEYATVGGGRQNTASGENSVVAGGAANNATGTDATVTGGQNNLASGVGACVTHGSNNQATANYAKAGGIYAKADKYAQEAHSGGLFSAPGDAQRSTMVMRLAQASHADDTWYNLRLDGLDQRITIAPDSTWLFTAMVVGSSQNSAQSWAYKVEGGIKRDNADNTTLVTSATTAISESDAAYDCQAKDNDADEELEIQIKKAAGGTDYAVRWVAKVELVEVVYA